MYGVTGLLIFKGTIIPRKPLQSKEYHALPGAGAGADEEREKQAGAARDRGYESPIRNNVRIARLSTWPYN